MCGKVGAVRASSASIARVSTVTICTPSFASPFARTTMKAIATLARAKPVSPRYAWIATRGVSSDATKTARAIATPATRPPEHVHTHAYTPLSRPHKAALTLGALLASFYNPARGDMIALLSELSGEPMLPRLREQMLESAEGRRLLLERPAINTASVDMAYLRSLDENTFGKQYVRWLDWCNVGPDTRAKVRYIEDPELAYVMQRYRECHDFYHVMCLMPVSHLGETVVKVFEAAHMGLPVAFLSSIAGPVRLSNEERAALFGIGGAGGIQGGLAGWAWRMGKKTKLLIGIRWEEMWERDFDELRREVGFDEDPPVKVTYEGRKRRASQTETLNKGRWPSKMWDIVQSSKKEIK